MKLKGIERAVQSLELALSLSRQNRNLSNSDAVGKGSYMLTWEASIDGKTWNTLSTTGVHTLYWLYSEPRAALRGFAVDRATRYADGERSSSKVAEKLRQGPRLIDGKAYDPADDIDADPLDLLGKSSETKGICTDYGNLLTLLARTAGLKADAIMFFGGFISPNGKNVWVSKKDSPINLEKVVSPNPSYNPPGQPSGWEFNYHVISQIEGKYQDAALDREGIDAQAVHEGLQVGIPTVDRKQLTIAKGSPVSVNMNDHVVHKRKTVHVTTRNYGEKVVPSDFDVIVVPVPSGASGTFDEPFFVLGLEGMLPPGLTYSYITGVLTGTPTTAGSYPLNAQVVMMSAFSSGPEHMADIAPFTLKVH